MSSFTKFDAELEVKFHPKGTETLGKDHWVTTNTFTYYIGYKNSDRYVTVPIGYLTDGASVPRLFWNIIPPWGKYSQAAVLHDYLCDYGVIMSVQGNAVLPIMVNRKEIDEIFYEALAVLNVNKFTISLMKRGVDLYRNLFKPTTPNIPNDKRALEKRIKEHYDKTGELDI